MSWRNIVEIIEIKRAEIVVIDDYDDNEHDE
jgi:hypothetical protein